MSHPVRWQRISNVRFYRLGRFLIADKGSQRFVIFKYSTGGYEARWQEKAGLGMPIGGAVLPTLREAIAYLRPKYETA